MGAGCWVAAMQCSGAVHVVHVLHVRVRVQLHVRTCERRAVCVACGGGRQAGQAVGGSRLKGTKGQAYRARLESCQTRLTLLVLQGLRQVARLPHAMLGCVRPSSQLHQGQCVARCSLVRAALHQGAAHTPHLQPVRADGEGAAAAAGRIGKEGRGVDCQPDVKCRHCAPVANLHTEGVVVVVVVAYNTRQRSEGCAIITMHPAGAYAQSGHMWCRGCPFGPLPAQHSATAASLGWDGVGGAGWVCVCG